MGGSSNRRWLRLRRYDDAVRERLEIENLCGVDEAGRGPLAGPVVAAAVVLPPKIKLPGLDDSKVMDPVLRDSLAEQVRASAIAVGWSCVGPREIERINILQATLLAMRRSVVRLAARAVPEYLLIDGRDTIPEVYWDQESVIEGDGNSLAIAAASVVAKTIRDRIMERIHTDYPVYGFNHNRGYGTPEHLEKLEEHGPCPWHRFTYAPIRQTQLFGSQDRLITS